MGSVNMFGRSKAGSSSIFDSLIVGLFSNLRSGDADSKNACPAPQDFFHCSSLFFHHHFTHHHFHQIPLFKDSPPILTTTDIFPSPNPMGRTVNSTPFPTPYSRFPYFFHRYAFRSHQFLSRSPLCSEKKNCRH